MTDKPLRITHVLAPAPVGGLETVVRALATGHAARGHSVSIIAMTEGFDHPFTRLTEADGLIVQRIGAEGRLHERAELEALFETMRSQIVHTHGYRPDVLALPVARRMGIGTASTLHGFTGVGIRVRLYERLQVRYAAKADAAIAVSTGVAARLRRAGALADNVHLVRNAYSRDGMPMPRDRAGEELGLQAGRRHVAWIGRLSREKAPDVMLEAMRYVTTKDVMLSFVGDGPDRASLEQHTDSLGLRDRVKFHGNVPGAARMLAAFDMLALSSRTEGTPMVLLEAMAAGVPIVATAVGGVPDILSAGEASLVAPNDPRALAAALDATLADTSLAQSRASAARERVAREFDHATWLDRYEQIYRAILK